MNTNIITSDLECLDHIRLRYQIFANNIYTLSGVLLGYRLAMYRDNDSFIPEFQTYLSKKNNVSSHLPWEDQIISEACNQVYEIPLFFQYLDEFRGIKYEHLAELDLSNDQRYYFFSRRIEKINMDYPVLPIKPPYKLKIVKIPNVKVHVFYCDADNNKYYEQCFDDLEYAKKWAKDCFNIEYIEKQISYGQP